MTSRNKRKTLQDAEYLNRKFIRVQSTVLGIQDVTHPVSCMLNSFPRLDATRGCRSVSLQNVQRCKKWTLTSTWMATTRLPTVVSENMFMVYVVQDGYGVTQKELCMSLFTLPGCTSVPHIHNPCLLIRQRGQFFWLCTTTGHSVTTEFTFQASNSGQAASGSTGLRFNPVGYTLSNGTMVMNYEMEIIQ